MHGTNEAAERGRKTATERRSSGSSGSRTPTPPSTPKPTRPRSNSN